MANRAPGKGLFIRRYSQSVHVNPWNQIWIQWPNLLRARLCALKVLKWTVAFVDAFLSKTCLLELAINVGSEEEEVARLW